ncbi:PadR family transcriptional regulator [Micrococcus sp. FDAARGOS_333]|uniref:PadR family transcriptional regulator n=1 Tax=Micrococcus sp. FDAARGOS_333 TaxID=1930558 RepID=UPI000B4E2C52|nr:PadR family transcriptional regulator [Micrococcus sp. FDAARGOS_333]PNL18567.1 PadR family transcriptional regulator [Micrococcus sp. FDAARGOS_333]
MSVKHSLLALLTHGPQYGYQLRADFEETTGGTWLLNIGQVYTTLDRLTRDGLVEDRGDDGEGHRIYALTDAGRAEVTTWFRTPLAPTTPPRNELAIKLAVAVTTEGVDVREVIQAQRTATLRNLQEYTRAKRAVPADAAGADLAGLLVLESLIFTAEAEARWLDHCEAAVVRASRNRSRRAWERAERRAAGPDAVRGVVADAFATARGGAAPTGAPGSARGTSSADISASRTDGDLR